MTPSRRAAETAKNERSKTALKIIQDKVTPDTIRKRAERQRRKEAGEVRVEVWLSADEASFIDFLAEDRPMSEAVRGCIRSVMKDVLKWPTL